MAKTSEYETYEYDNYASQVMQGLDELRKEGISCDAVLQTMDGERFRVHQNVLMAVSPYFRVMFTGGFKEAQNNTENATVLPTISSVGLKPVLDCLYSGKLLLTPETVYDVLPAAHMLQLNDILGSCTKFLVKNMCTVTCFQNRKFSEKYELDELNDVSEDFILNNFAELSTTTEFKEMSDTSLCEYFKHPKLKGSEIEIFRAAKEWLEFESDRKVHLVEVMAFINFKAISVNTLVDEVMKYELLKSDAECFEMVMDAMKYHSNLFSQPLNPPSMLRGEMMLVTIIACGRPADNGREVNIESSIKLDACKLSSIHPEGDGMLASKIKPVKCSLEIGSLNIVNINNFIYLFGTDWNTFTPVAKRYDATIGIWIDLVPPPRLGTHGSAAAYTSSGTIMMIGGVLVIKDSGFGQVPASKLIDTSLCYTIDQNQWNQMKSCPIPVAYHCICSHKGLVYVAGGYVAKQTFNAAQPSKKLFAYDTKASLWLSKANMNAARAEAVLEAVNDKLFVLGGGNMFGIGAPVAAASIEMYDIEQNQWTTVAESDPATLMYASSSFLREKMIFVAGGYNIETKENSGNIFMFDTDSMSISKVQAEYRYRLSRHACVVLKVHNI